MNRLAIIMLFLVPALAAILAGSVWAAPQRKQLKVLVVAGGHAYPVQPFRAIFDFYKDMRCTFVEERETAEAFEDLNTFNYDVIVLYNYMRNPTPAQQRNILAVTRKGTGLVIVHHAIYGYRPWPEYARIVGVTSWLTGTEYNVRMRIKVADADHPITRGLSDFEVVDETYAGSQLAPGVRVLLETDEPRNARHIAWVHQYNRSPVAYIQLGHGESAYKNQHFVEILGRAIRWAAQPPRDRQLLPLPDYDLP